MKTATIRTAALDGIQGRPLDVAVSVAEGAARVDVPSYPDHSTRETSVRVLSSLAVLGIRDLAITVSLPDGTKPDPAFDLPIAVAVLVAIGRVKPKTVQGTTILGELGLDGAVRMVRGMYPRLVRVESAIVPTENATEASYHAQAARRSASHLRDFLGVKPWPLTPPSTYSATDLPSPDLRVSFRMARALEIAATGGLPLFLVGPLGTGKMVAARALAALLPPLSESEAAECTAIHSASGILSGAHVTARPFRAPHHTVSEAGLVGTAQRPGEVNLATNGVLLLDEIDQFRAAALESVGRALRHGQERGIAARPVLVGSFNQDRNEPEDRLRARLARFTGRLRVGFDVWVRSDLPSAEGSIRVGEEIRERVRRARKVAVQPRLELQPNVARVAAAIAALDDSSEIRDEHVVEARSFTELQ